MKKSFLKRVMAAAVAVPVALTQTAMFASFAAGEETTADGKIIDKGTFVNVECDTEKNAPATGTYKAPEAAIENAIVQENDWNGDLRAALTALYDADDGVVTLNPAKLADDISSDVWYSTFVKEALRAEGTSVKAEIKTDTVVITIDVDYNYGQLAANNAVESLSDAYKNAVANLNSKAVVKGQIVITADTADLDINKNIPLEATYKFDGMADGQITDVFVPYVQGIFETVKAEVNAAVEAAGLDVSALDSKWDRYQGKINTAQRAINRAGESYTANYEASDIQDLYDQAYERAVKQSPRFERLPDSWDAARDCNAYACAYDIFTDVVNKINEKPATKKSGYTVVMTLDDICDTVEDLSNITAHAEAADFNYEADMWGYLPDDDFELDTYVAYFNKQLEAEGKEVVEDSIQHVKVAEMSVEEKTADLTGDVALNVYRVVWYTETEDITETESETETDTTPDESDTTPDESDTTPDESDTTPDESDTTPDESDTTPDESDTDEIHTRDDVKVTVHGGFYFSHDPRAFDPMELIDSATITEDGTDRAITEKEKENFSFSFRRNSTLSEAEPSGEAVSPQSAYADGSLNPLGGYFGQSIYVYYEGELVDASANIFIGVKGDVNNDGVANASDAAKILIYAAEVGAGDANAKIYSSDNENFENLAYFLGDTNGESQDHGKTTTYVDAENTASPLNASDASQILIYTALINASDDGKCDWIPEVIIAAPYPKFSYEIAKDADLI